MNRPVLVTPTRVDADSHRIPSGMARAADTAIIDDVSKIDRCWRSDSDSSCVHRATTVSRDGRLSGCSARASSRTLVHSLRSPATSSGGALIVAARRDEVRSSPSRSPSTVVNSVSGSSSPCALSDSAISGISWRPMPQRSASAARTHTGRRAKRDDAQYFDDVSCRPPREKVLGECPVGPIHAFNPTDLFDHEPQRRIDEVLIELTPPYTVGKGEFAYFADNAGAQSERRSSDALRQGDEVPLDAHRVNRGTSSPGPPYTLARRGPTPRSARVAHSLRSFATLI